MHNVWLATKISIFVEELRLLLTFFCWELDVARD